MFSVKGAQLIPCPSEIRRTFGGYENLSTTPTLWGEAGADGGAEVGADDGYNVDC